MSIKILTKKIKKHKIMTKDGTELVIYKDLYRSKGLIKFFIVL